VWPQIVRVARSAIDNYARPGGNLTENVMTRCGEDAAKFLRDDGVFLGPEEPAV
jgi:hypothetical protein